MFKNILAAVGAVYLTVGAFKLYDRHLRKKYAAFCEEVTGHKPENL